MIAKNNQRSFQGKPFNFTVIQVYVPTINAKEAEVDCMKAYKTS